MAMPLFRATQTDLHQGMSWRRRSCALFEVIRRDALSIAEQKRDMGRRLSI